MAVRFVFLVIESDLTCHFKLCKSVNTIQLSVFRTVIFSIQIEIHGTRVNMSFNHF